MDGRQSGFGLTEAIVAMALFAVMLGALLPAFTMNFRTNTTNELRSGAVAVAQQELDNLRATPTWPASGTELTVATGAAQYRAVLTYNQYCEGTVCYDGARHVSMEVWHHARLLYRVETVFTTLDESGT